MVKSGASFTVPLLGETHLYEHPKFVESTHHPGHGQHLSHPTPTSSCVNCVVGNITVDSPRGGMALDPANGRLFVTNWSVFYNLTVVNTSTNQPIKTLTTEYAPVGVTYDDRNGDVYVSGGDSGIIDVFNGSTYRLVTTINVLNSKAYGNPQASAYDPLNGRIYVVTASSITNDAGNLTVIDGSNNTIVATVPLKGGAFPDAQAGGANPEWVVVDSSNGEAYVANPLGISFGPSLAVVNITTNRLVTRVSLPYCSCDLGGLTLGGANGDLYVLRPSGSLKYPGNVSVIATSNNTMVANIPVGLDPQAIVYDPANGYLYVTNAGSNNVSIIDTTTDKLVGSVSVRSSPGYAYYAPQNGDIYVSDQNSNDLSVISPSGVTPVTLSSVAVSPSSASVSTNQSITFTATPACSGGPCPSGATYSWTLTQALGSLNSSAGNPVIFTAGSNSGNLSLFVNASLNGITKQAGPIAITITKSSGHTLSSVAVSPTSASVLANGTQMFSAIPTCTGGPCPVGTSYAWSLNNSLGSVNPTTGATTTFAAGPTEGAVSLTVNATLNGISKQAVAPVTITSNSILTSVTVAPSTPTVTVNGTQNFTATAGCTSTCPSGVTYVWALNNTLGGVSPSTGSATTFTAGPTAGTALLSVKATLNGSTKWANATITITPVPPVFSSVSISPTSITVGVGNSTSFTAYPNCTGGTCPSGATYSWALNNTALGTISPTTGPTETFTAGNTAGSVLLYATASLNGIHQTGLAIINITKGIVPTVTGLTLTPSPTVTVQVGKTVNFSTSVTCNVSPCPTGIAYSWVLSNILGNLSSTSGSSVVLTTGAGAGATSLTVTAQLNGGSKTATSDITITSSVVPVITGVTITPSFATVRVSQGRGFTANGTCFPGPCPSSTTYTWALNNYLGSLSPSTGTSTLFTAGSSPGSVTLSVNATFNGKTVTSSVVITISPTVTPPTFLGLPGYDGYILMVVVATVVVAIIVFARTRRKKSEETPPPSTGHEGYPNQPPYPPGQ